MRIRTAIGALALLATIPLGACQKTDGEAATGVDSVDRTLAAAISDAPGLTTVSSSLADAGLAGVFDGPGSYTVLAPSDDAFAKLGEGAEELTSGAEKPVLVAVLRDHILPGHMTPETIRESIDKHGGEVEVRTLGDGTVKFSLKGEDIAVTSDDGMSATIDGSAIAASNGVVIPIDGLLKQPRPIAQ